MPTPATTNLYADGLLIRTHHNETLSNIESFSVPIRAVPAADIVF